MSGEFPRLRGPAERRAPLAWRGFTLIELMVALFITAVVFAMGYGAINQGLSNRSILEDKQDRLLKVQTAVRVLTQDFMQLAPRPVREAIGDGWQNAISGQAGSQPLVSLTRSGWANPAGIQRPALQRVSYSFDNSTLHRSFWPELDVTESTTAVKRDLLDHVKSVGFRYMDSSRQWHDQWPLTTVNGDLTYLRMRPIAVEVTLELEDWGKIVRVIEIPG